MVKVSREKWGSKWRWVVRDRGQFVPRSVREQVLRDKFTPKKYKKKYVEYTKLLHYQQKGKDYGKQTEVSVIEEVKYDFSLKDMEDRLNSRELDRKLRGVFDGKSQRTGFEEPTFHGGESKFVSGGARFTEWFADPVIRRPPK